jgi:hypothetical protein
MESAKLSFHKWYFYMAFMSSTKKGISALEIQRQLGHKRYGTVWRLMHKIREGMGKRENLYQLNGSVEFDESYFEYASSKKQNLSVVGESKKGQISLLWRTLHP